MTIRVTLDDHTGNISHQANMDETAPVGQLITAIITFLGLPIIDPAGHPITYHLSYNNRRLQENETLASAGVQAGDMLVIVPEMTAGPSFLANLDTAIKEIQAAREELLHLPLHLLYATVPYDPSTIRVHIVEEPLTAQNLATVILALTELHTKCWLIQRGRFGDLIDYTQTLNGRFTEEANLVITRMAHNSPLEINFAPLDPKNIAEALVIAINGVTQTRQRLKKVALENQEKAEQIRQAEKRAEQEHQAKQQELAIAAQKTTQESQIRELDAQSAHADQKQARQIAAQEAELEKQKSLLVLEQQQLEIERRRLEIQEKRLDMEKKRIDYALEIATDMVGILRPDADTGTKELLLGTLVPNLLQLGNGKGLELVSPLQETQKPEGTQTLFE